MYQFSKLCQKMVSGSVRKQSEMWQKNFFWLISDTSMMMTWNISRKHSQKTVRKISNDTFLTHFFYLEGAEVIFLTDFWMINWCFSDTILKTDTVLTDFQIFSNKFLTQFCIWLFSDRYLTHLRLISDWFLELTVFWLISDRYWTDFQKLGDQH